MAGPVGNRFGGQPTGAPPPPMEAKKWGDTVSKAGEVARVFVASIDYRTTSCAEIEQRFAQYGVIIGIDQNQKNFAFIQYSSPEEAQRAVAEENGRQFKNKKIEVKLFDKSGHPQKANRAGGGQPQPMQPYRDRSRSPNRAGGGGRPMGGPTGTRHGTIVQQYDYDQYDGDYSYGQPVGGHPHPPPGEPVLGNEAEIIVIHKAQWPYAEMIQKRIKAESSIAYVDLLFLHNLSTLNTTLNDLYERQTFYALVIAPVNEEHRSVTVHVLHNQTEHRNMPLDDAILLIAKDYQAVIGQNQSGPPPPATVPKHIPREPETKLPEEVSYLLRSTLDNGPKVLTLTQLEVLIDYFQKEKTRLTTPQPVGQQPGYTGMAPTGQQPNAIDLEKQKASLFDNPHVQAALSSLMQIGALGSGGNSSAANASANNGLTANSNPYGGQQPAPTNSAATRRHPLLGTEVPQPASRQPPTGPNIPGAPGGLVRYPPPQLYNQYSSGYQF